MIYFDVLHNKATIKIVPTFKDGRPYMTSYGFSFRYSSDGIVQ